MVGAAERQMIETGEKISERIGLLYDPLYLGCDPLFRNDAKSLWPDATLS
jgi:hypothetical protein